MRIALHLSLNRFNILLKLPVTRPDLVEDFPDFPETVNIRYLINLSSQISLSSLLYLLLLVRTICIIGNSSSVLQSIMHGKFLLEVSDFFLVSFDQ